jgi:uroporphyrinogen-III synthase
MESRGRIISTRVLPENLKDQISSEGYELIERDFIEVVSLDASGIEIENDIVMVSSKNAIEGFDLLGRRIYCVGEKTKEAVEGAGGEVVRVFEGSRGMAEFVGGLGLNATFICGVRRMKSVEEVFEESELQIIEAYETELKSFTFIGGFEAALFFSPSGVESFFKSNTLQGVAICIGETTQAEALKHTSSTLVAQKTTIESVVEALLEKTLS